MTRRLNAGRAALLLWLITLLYLGVLLWVDHGRGVLSGIGRIISMFPLLLMLSLGAFLARYLRWRWLLLRIGASFPASPGFLAYLSGFAFTASPGKVGELLRIRYFLPMGVPAAWVVSAFVFERVFDLLVLLCFASIAASGLRVFPMAVAFVLAVLGMVFMFARYPERVRYVSGVLARRGFVRLARLLAVFSRGFKNVSAWMTVPDVLVSLLAGVVAWGMTSGVFMVILDRLALDIPWMAGFSYYPVAMLAGAASMLPGGIGPTEAVLVVMLSNSGVDLANATLAAMSIRLATLWFATLLGLLSMLWLEPRATRVEPLVDGGRT